ncbi:hypothetical protein [Paludibacterium yongneupense]|uniref:hypothetical protein n=1 Tax=Paludibacterium yongneupense TaxID=400061 RepID=UPI000400324F|nr:hypothetical protein [Paludibacterium yongneupense]
MNTLLLQARHYAVKALLYYQNNRVLIQVLVVTVLALLVTSVYSSYSLSAY